MVRGLYVEANAPLFIRDVSCNGSESALLDCPYNMLTQTSCGPFSDAGIVCQGETTVHGKLVEPDPLALSCLQLMEQVLVPVVMVN